MSTFIYVFCLQEYEAERVEEIGLPAVDAISRDLNISNVQVCLLGFMIELLFCHFFQLNEPKLAFLTHLFYIHI